MQALAGGEPADQVDEGLQRARLGRRARGDVPPVLEQIRLDQRQPVAVAEGLLGRFALGVHQPRRDDVRPGVKELLHDRLAQAAGAAGDQRDALHPRGIRHEPLPRNDSISDEP